MKFWMSLDEKTQTERFLIASAIGIFIVFIFNALGILVYPTADRWALACKLIIFVPMAIVGIICIAGAMLFIDFISKRAWLNQIERTEYGPTAIYIAVILVIGRLLSGGGGLF